MDLETGSIITLLVRICMYGLAIHRKCGNIFREDSRSFSLSGACSGDLVAVFCNMHSFDC